MMVEYFIPKLMHPHGLGAKYGSYLFPIYLTLEELRRYHPEPIEYFIFHGTEQ
ncbi:hypothetical protein KAU33_03970 [Candidatus Dependentiae bacterium]|nr:hypothetical protein [Candidatus Dependentiae bacterium]